MGPIQSLRSLKQTLSQRLNPQDPEACGPTGLAQRHLSVTDYARQYQTPWHPVYPRLALPPWRSPQCWGKHKPDLRGRLKRAIPPTGVLEIPGGQVLGIQGYTFGKDDYFLPDLSYHRDRLEYSHLPKTKDRYTIQQLPGRVLSLMSNASNNYYHCMLDCLPRLHLFAKAGFSVDDVDFIHLPKPSSDNGWSILNQLGLDESKYIWAEPDKGIEAEMLYGTTHPGLHLVYPRWVFDFWRNSLRYDISEPRRRIYISRPKGRRSIANQAELDPILERFGFETVAMETVENQPQLFHDAEAIATAHGAALVNLIFCQPGTKVLELMTLDQLAPHYQVLTQQLQLDHGRIFGPVTERSHRSKWRGVSFDDFTIDSKAFEQALNSLLPNSPA